jgi:hypothetical protein
VPRFVGALGVFLSVPLASPHYALTLPLIQTFGLILPILTSIFLTSTSLVVTYVSVRAYMRERLLSVLFLGCGALIFGFTTLVTAVLLGTEEVNFSGTVFVLGALFSAAFHLACASSTYLARKPRLGGRYHAFLWVQVALLIVVSIVVAAFFDALPPFYAVGNGTTEIGQVSLGAAAAAFGLSSVMVLAVFSSSRSRVLYWYSMALGATAAGLVGVILSDGQIVNFEMRVGWAALYLGGLFLLMSVLSAERMGDRSAAKGAPPT